MDSIWGSWLTENVRRMAPGQRVRVPGWMPHPRTAGFVQESLAEPAGQVEDWVLPLMDGSRIHLHGMPDGTFVAHRDVTDPARSPLHAIWHWLTESKGGRFVVITAGIGLVVALLAAGSKRR